jgi:hypothetical protein
MIKIVIIMNNLITDHKLLIKIKELNMTNLTVKELPHHL